MARLLARNRACQLCGKDRWLEPGGICDDCLGELDQPTRNRMFAGEEERSEAIKDLRLAKRAKELGLRVHLSMP